MQKPDSNFSSLISELRHKKLFLEPLSGNNGDTLILMGMRHILEKNNVALCSSPEEADVILLNGGGAMNDLWPSGAAQVLDSYIDKYPSKDFVVGPSSYHFTQLDFSEIANKAKSKIDLFCRELISLEYLRTLPLTDNVHLHSSQDLALELADSAFISELKGTRTADIVLCALRKDLEGQAGVVAKVRAPFLPALIRKPLSKLRDRMAALMSNSTLNDILKTNRSLSKGLPVVYRDVSVSVDFQEFCETISKAKLIITDRLHVAILGALLEKEVRLIKGKYHKAQGVYEFSLAKKPNIALY